jgi:iron complex transport system substrate-binding protein
MLVGAMLLCVAPIAFSGPPRRVISLSPNVTETIFALGAGDRVVGVSDFCRRPPAVLRLPRLGGLVNPNLERVVALRPDLIVLLGRSQAVEDLGRSAGIPVENVQMKSVATIRSGIMQVGKALGVEDRATSLTRRLDAELAALRAEADAVPIERRPRVFLSLTRQPGSVASLFTAGGGSFLDEAVTLAGGVNVMRDATQPFPQASQEALIERRPDVILEMEAGQNLSAKQRQSLIDDWRALGTLPAVAHGRVRVLTDEDLLEAGPNLPSIVRRLRAAIQSAGAPGASADKNAAP